MNARIEFSYIADGHKERQKNVYKEISLHDDNSPYEMQFVVRDMDGLQFPQVSIYVANYNLKRNSRIAELTFHKDELKDFIDKALKLIEL